METKQGIEIMCPGCGRESLLKREPLYDGFRRVGEKLSCLACGRTFASEAEVPFKTVRQPRVFDKTDAPAPVKIFKAGEAGRLCRHCADYVVNPFVQRCARRGKIVEATDSCPFFSARPQPADESGAKPAPKIKL